MGGAKFARLLSLPLPAPSPAPFPVPASWVLGMVIQPFARVLSAICLAAMVIPLLRDGLPGTLFTSPTDYVAFALFAAPAVLFAISTFVGRRSSWRS